MRKNEEKKTGILFYGGQSRANSINQLCATVLISTKSLQSWCLHLISVLPNEQMDLLESKHGII